MVGHVFGEVTEAGGAQPLRGSAAKRAGGSLRMVEIGGDEEESRRDIVFMSSVAKTASAANSNSSSVSAVLAGTPLPMK